MFFISNIISNTAKFDEFKKHPTEGSSEMANKIQSPKKQIERKSRGVKHFYNYKIAKMFSVVKTYKLKELVSLNVTKLVYQTRIPSQWCPL